jgi:hypothetical protein
LLKAQKIKITRLSKIGRGLNIIGYYPIWSDFSKARMQEKHFN